ncbi:MAG: 16S rRNA (cytosine(1402)-N(4))-methyltransferase RsmH [Chloroflexi bacterium]|nr:MAG: 16S rRNA (cytosine(1402)-N(4))-methyltransferase RsmH [Chloroflexota bacterium]TMG63331.1 MAG: 16S rRNA (cytosine(1402)-N(4))-methyltransferase RsmH [Chloroflexota bacterium]
MKRTRTGRGESSSRRISGSTRPSEAKPSSSGTPTTSRSGSRGDGAPSSPESRAVSRTISETSGSSDGIERAHEPVLVAEVLAELATREGGRYVDATVGGGGHAAAILDAAAPSGRLLGLDRDPAALAIAARELARFGDRAILARANFADLDDVAGTHGFVPVDGVLLDLGLSSIQLADEERGFSFRSRGALDMRADPDGSIRAADIVNSWAEKDLRRVFAEYGEEPEAARVAGAIVRRRVKAPFEAADDLGRFVAGVKTRRPRGIDPATRVFQALRIAVNDELANLERALAAAMRSVRPGGRIVVISFHSLEDRIVKQFFARESRDCICPPHLPTCVCGHRAGLRALTRRPLRAASAEVDRNPRARSAALRAAERLP